MEHTLLSIIFWIMLIIGGTALCKHNDMNLMLADFTKHKGIVFLGALMSLFFGFTLLAVYNSWMRDEYLIITVMGRGSVIKGVIMLYCPDVALKSLKLFGRKDSVAIMYRGAIIVFVALLIGYVVYF